QFFRLFLKKNNPEPGMEDLNEERLKTFLALPKKVLLKFLAQDPEMNLVPLFGKITAPVLLIHGELDLNVDPKHTDYAAGQIPDALVYKFPRAGHNPWLTGLAEFCDVVRQFVETGEVEGAQRRGLPERG
ncbi:MAG: alpha/beta hydrolase, partial [bacterium]